MRPNEVSRRLLFALLLTFLLFVAYGTFSSFDHFLIPQRNSRFSKLDFVLRIEELLGLISDTFVACFSAGRTDGPRVEGKAVFLAVLALACAGLIWRTALSMKRRTRQRSERQVQELSEERHAALDLEEVSDLSRKIQDLENQLERSKDTVSSTRQEYEELKESFEAFKLLTGSTALERETEALEKQVEITADLVHGTPVEPSLAQEQFRHRETELKDQINALETRICRLNEEQQKNEQSYKTQIRELEEHFKGMESLLRSTKLENEELKESFKAFRIVHASTAEENHGLRRSLEQGQNERLKTQVEMMTVMLQEKEDTLEQKLAQQELHRQASEAKVRDKIDALQQNVMETSLEQEEREDLNEIQLKDSLKIQLEERIKLLQEDVRTLQHKLSQEEARTAQANEHFVEYREGILQAANEQQASLKAQTRRHKNRAREILMAYHESSRLLANEKRRTACLHRMLEHLNDKLTECSRPPQTLPHRTDAPVHRPISPSPSTSSAVDQQPAERQRTLTFTTSKRNSNSFPDQR